MGKKYNTVLSILRKKKYLKESNKTFNEPT